MMTKMLVLFSIGSLTARHGVVGINDNVNAIQLHITEGGNQQDGPPDQKGGDSLMEDVEGGGNPKIITIGSNTGNKKNKCVTSDAEMFCAADAGNKGKRANDNSKEDTFNITTEGKQVCATRTNVGAVDGWHMELAIKCHMVPPTQTPTPAPTTKPTANPTKKIDTLEKGSGLKFGEELKSTNLKYRFIMQSDGNAVVIGPDGTTFNTGPKGGDAEIILQTDGNLVVYDENGNAKWAAGTTETKASYLIMQGDGELVMYTAENHAIWKGSLNNNKGGKV